MAKFALAHTEAPLSVEQESASELKQEALQVLEQLEYSRGEAVRIVEDIFAKNKNLKTTEDFLRKVFEQLHPENKTVGTGCSQPCGFNARVYAVPPEPVQTCSAGVEPCATCFLCPENDWFRRN